MRLSRSLVFGILLAATLVPCGCSSRKAAEGWKPVEIPTDAEFMGIWFTDSLNGWITGGGYMIDGGIVGRTRDGGRTWSFQTGVLASAGSQFNLNRVQFRDTLRGCAVGYGGFVLVTDDGGASWRSVRHGRSPGDGLFDVQFIDDHDGWAIGSASVIRTEDGGQTWGPLVYSTSENGYLSGNVVHFVDAQVGWMAGHSGILRRSGDGGRTWTEVPLPLRTGERPALWDIFFSDALHGWVVGERGSIFHTEDGGSTWALQENGVPVIRSIPKGEAPRPREPIPELEIEPDRLAISAVQFADLERGFAVGYYADVGESVILGTIDGGATWRVERVVPGEVLRALFVLDRTHAWAVGDRSRTATQVVLRYSGDGS
jgi:photosystem II stability/assembly factor-like uncharacterized protein